MSHIAEGGGRTVYNCTVYDARKLYEVTLHMDLPEVQSVYGTGEVERTGRIVTEDRVYHIVATSDAMARALVTEKWCGPHSPRAVILTLRVLFVIDGEISYGHK